MREIVDAYDSLVGNLEDNKWSHTAAPPVCLHGMDKDNFILVYFGNGYF